MNISEIHTWRLHKDRLIFVLLFAEYLIMVLKGFHFCLDQDPMYQLIIDPVYFFIFGLHFPQWLAHHFVLAIVFELFIFLSIIQLIRKPDHPILYGLFFLLLIKYVGFTGYLGHRNYQAGFVYVLFPFLFQNKNTRMLAWDILRYFLLFYYFSSAIFKLSDDGWLHISHMSDVLSRQHVLSASGDDSTILNHFITYLIYHPMVAQCFFWIALLVEGATVIGFFTRKYDYWLAICLILFHLTNGLLIGISPFGQLTFILLLLGDSYHFEEKKA